MTRFRALPLSRSGRRSAGRSACAGVDPAAGGCTGTPRSVKSLPPTEYKALQEIGSRVGEESGQAGRGKMRACARRSSAMHRAWRRCRWWRRSTTRSKTRIVTLNMNDASVGGLLWALAEQLGMNLIVDPDVLARDQRASLFLKNVTAREVYNHILTAFDLYGETRGGGAGGQPDGRTRVQRRDAQHHYVPGHEHRRRCLRRRQQRRRQRRFAARQTGAGWHRGQAERPVQAARRLGRGSAARRPGHQGRRPAARSGALQPGSAHRLAVRARTALAGTRGRRPGRAQQGRCWRGRCWSRRS